MASTATTRLGIRKQGTGDNEDTWGSELNDDALDLFDEAHGVETISLTGNVTLTSTDYVTNQARNMGLRLTDGGLSASPTITIPAKEKVYIVQNTTAYAVVFSAGGTTATIAAAHWANVYCDGTDVYASDLFKASDANAVAGSTPYTFSSTTTDSDPGAGIIRFNNSSQSSTTELYVDDLDGGGTDLSAWFVTWDDSTSTNKGTIWVSKRTDTTAFLSFTLTALTDASGYVKFTVTNLAASATNPFVDGDEVYIQFSRAGEKGDNGDVGGPVSSTDNAIARWNGTAGNLIQNSGWTITDADVLTANGNAINVDTGTFNQGGEVKFLSEGNVSTDRSYDETTERDIAMTATGDFNVDFETPNSGMIYSHVLWITQDGTGGRTVTIRDGSNTAATWLGNEPVWSGLAASALTIVSVFYAPSGTLYAAEVTQ